MSSKQSSYVSKITNNSLEMLRSDDNTKYITSRAYKRALKRKEIKLSNKAQNKGVK